MATRKIAKNRGLDILRWGYRIKGMLTIKEGYQLQVEHLKHQETNTWESIWKEKTWSKISFFI